MENDLEIISLRNRKLSKICCIKMLLNLGSSPRPHETSSTEDAEIFQNIMFAWVCIEQEKHFWSWVESKRDLTGRGKLESWMQESMYFLLQCGLNCFSLNHVLFFTFIPKSHPLLYYFFSRSTDHLLTYQIMYLDSCLLQIICLPPAKCQFQG